MKFTENELFFQLYYMAVMRIESYDTDNTDFNKCAEIAYELADKAMNSMHEISAFDALEKIMDEELPKRFDKRR